MSGWQQLWLTYELRPNSGYVHEPFYATWSAYAFFIGGLLQLLVGILEVFRNNVYGATAFMAFGSFWLANGIQMLIRTYFPEEIPDMSAAVRKSLLEIDRASPTPSTRTTG